MSCFYLKVQKRFNEAGEQADQEMDTSAGKSKRRETNSRSYLGGISCIFDLFYEVYIFCFYTIKYIVEL